MESLIGGEIKNTDLLKKDLLLLYSATLVISFLIIILRSLLVLGELCYWHIYYYLMACPFSGLIILIFVVNLAPYSQLSIYDKYRIYIEIVIFGVLIQVSFFALFYAFFYILISAVFIFAYFFIITSKWFTRWILRGESNLDLISSMLAGYYMFLIFNGYLALFFENFDILLAIPFLMQPVYLTYGLLSGFLAFFPFFVATRFKGTLSKNKFLLVVTLLLALLCSFLIYIPLCIFSYVILGYLVSVLFPYISPPTIKDIVFFMFVFFPFLSNEIITYDSMLYPITLLSWGSWILLREILLKKYKSIT